ncbi:hypothetical protein KCU67_g16018, partial [Aureobasidium melanogenum]
PNTAQSLQQSSAMSMLGRPMILPGQPSQTPPPTYPQPISQPGQQMNQTMARPRQWQPMTNNPGGSKIYASGHRAIITNLQIKIPAAQGWSHEQLRRNFMHWKYQQIQKQNPAMAEQIMNVKGQAQLNMQFGGEELRYIQPEQTKQMFPEQSVVAQQLMQRTQQKDALQKARSLTSSRDPRS